MEVRELREREGSSHLLPEDGGKEIRETNAAKLKTDFRTSSGCKCPKGY